MSRPRQFTSRTASLATLLLCGLATGVLPVAVASPPTDATWQPAGASAEGGNPFRGKMAAQWAPVRSERNAASQPTPSAPRIANKQSQNSPPPTAPARPATKPTQNAAAPPTVPHDPQWRLPNGQATVKQASNNSPAAQSASREPRPFDAPENATRIAPSSPRAPSSPNDSKLRNGVVATSYAAQDSAAIVRPPAAPSYRKPARGRAPMNSSDTNFRPRMSHRNPRANPIPSSYGSRMWDAINVAFQEPEAMIGGQSEPENLPLPGMDHGGRSDMSGPDYFEPNAGGDSYDGYGDPGSCPGGCDECGTMCGDACEPGCGCPNGQCEHECDLNCIGPGDAEACQTVRIGIPRWQDLQVFGGVQGFKGPYDRDRDSGNFGFHEGFNSGWKLPYTPLGYQIGYRAVHSQLSGDKDTGIADPHTQNFITAGIFQRSRHGLQLGIAWDMLRDERWNTADFHQLRGELSFVDRGCHEWGLAANVHLNQHELFPVNTQTPTTIYQATDQYLLFYRFHGSRGGEGRFFGGFNDDDDGILGADMLLPLQERWSLQAGFTYLIPSESGGAVGAQQEAWNIGMALVWHWDKAARRCHSNCYRPLFNVADNGSLIIDDRLGAPATGTD